MKKVRVLTADEAALLVQDGDTVSTGGFVSCACPEALTKARKKKDCHRLTCRISCRLETEEYAKLKRLVEAEGYGTMQDWLVARIRKYIKDGDSDALCDF